MRIIFGLGNPGEKFEETRHNVGFLALDTIQKKFGFSEFIFEKKFKGEFCEKTIKNEKILLVKPHTFMNLSGQTVRAFLDFFKIPTEKIMIVHDDLDIKLGKIKLAKDSSSAGHNGVGNIFDVLGTQKIRRLRIGINKANDEKKTCQIDAHDYVLGKFSKEDLEELKKIEKEIMQEVETFFNL